MRNLNETGVIHHKNGGHNHDGESSTKVDFSTYSREELNPIIETLRGELFSGSEETEVSVASSSDSIFFHQAGEVAVSPAVVAKKVFQIEASSISIVVTLGTEGSTSTTIAIYKNGSLLGNVTVPAGEGVTEPYVATISASFNGTTDYVQARVTAAGTGATELGVEVIAVP